MPDGGARPEGTLLAFDFGHRRIGVAVGQTLTGTASALAVVAAAAERPDWPRITQIMSEWKPSAVVVGLPLDEDGGPTEMSEAARRFGAELQARCGVPVFYEDERLSSRAAEQRFVRARARGALRRKDAALKDALAAQIILENWLQSPGSPAA